MSTAADRVEAGRSTDVDERLEDLWARFKRTGDRALRDRLVLHYAPLVKWVAGRMASRLPAHLDREDLYSQGMFGLLDAIDRFVPERGNPFEPYAMTRIRGALVDEMRAADWAPRSVRDRAREVGQAFATLQMRLQRTPTDEEVAEEVGMSVDDLHGALSDVAATRVGTLDQHVGGGGDDAGLPLAEVLEDVDAQDPERLVAQAEGRELLASAIMSLAERDKIVVSLYYFEGLRLVDIATVLGVTESRVSQILAKATHTLRGTLAA